MKNVYHSRLIAHRGGPNDTHPYPENTLYAFNTIANYIEIDIIRLKDGKWIVFHDDTLECVAELKPDDKIRTIPLTELTYDQISHIDIGKKVDEKFRDTRIPLLTEFLDLLKKNKHTAVIEIKSKDIAVAPELATLIKNNGFAHEKLFFICFDIGFIAALKKLLPVYPHYVVRGADPDVEKNISDALQANLQGLDVKYSETIDHDFVKKIHDAGLKLIVWNDPKNDNVECAKKLLEMGVDFVNTNKPEILLQDLCAHPVG